MIHNKSNRIALRFANLTLGLLVSAPFLAKSRLFRRHLYGSINLYRHTHVYSDFGSERYLSDSRDMIIGRELFCTGQYEFEKFVKVMDIISDLGTPDGLLLIDVGANIGSICIPAVNRGFVIKAIAIEPHPENARLLRANIALNDLTSKIAVHQCAMGANDGESLQLELSTDNSGDHRIVTSASGTNSVTVRSETMDKVCSATDASVALLWIDTQGYEGYVLAGARQWIARHVLICSEFAPYLMKRSESFMLFKRSVAGYSGFIDLERPEHFRAINELDALYYELGEDTERYTDILLSAEPLKGSSRR